MGDKFRPIDAPFDDESTQTIELTELFTRDLTTTGSFDVRSEIWKTTFGKVIQALPIPTLLIDQSFRIAVANQAWGKISIKYEEMQDVLFSRLFPEAHVARRVQSLLEDVFSTRKPVVAHGKLERGDSRIWARMTFRSIRVMEERFILVLVEDLTADKRIVEQGRKHREELEKRVEERTSEVMAANAQLEKEVAERNRMEIALRESEERYRILAENSLAGIYVYQDGKFVYVNRRTTEVMGYLEHELIGKSPLILVAPEDLEKVRDIAAARRQGKQAPSQYEFRALTKTGKVIWTEALVTDIEHDGRPATLGNVQDITDRKKAEEALRESEEKYRIVVENAGEAIFVVQSGMLKFLNRRTSELIGYSEDELTSRPFAELIHPDDRAMVVDRHERRIKGEQPPSVYAFRIVDNSGSIKWVEVNAVSVLWERKAATLGFLVDITDKRKMEDDLVKVAKLESLGVLAGGIAHDFNNILTAILGNISLAKMHCQSPDKAKGRMIEAEKACIQAQGLTQQLLTFSKGGAPIKRTAHISQLIADCCHFAVRGSNVRCELSVQNDLFTVEADKGQIGQVINNLIINSVHAMPQGGVIHVHAENVLVNVQQGLALRGGNYVKIVVHDEGVGIPKNILPRIFDPYFTTKHKGSGLGLATSYSIIRNHDGMIAAESEVGTGTTFCVYLPASQGELQTSLDMEETPATGSGRILLMDDEESIREVAREILSTLGYEVELARNGSEAISLYRAAKHSTYPFDVVVLDLTVAGGMGGAEAIEKLCEIDSEVKAVVSSGYSNDPIMSDYTKYGFKGVAAKPYTAKELGAILRTITAGSR
jgi:PAS domain S-box-containing protein